MRRPFGISVVLFLALTLFGKSSIGGNPPPGVDVAKINTAVHALHEAIMRLRLRALRFGVPEEKANLFVQYVLEKIFPQIGFDTSIVVVAGPTNVGKSTISNMIWGGNEPITTVIHTAAGTKYPVVGVHESAGDESAVEGFLKALFPGFEPKRKKKTEDPITAADKNYLFYAYAPGRHRDRLLIDLPDHDSDRMENADIAYACGRIADIVVAVTTDQKYIDKVSVDYFAELARAGKPIVLVINQIDVEYDWKNVKDWVGQWKQAITHSLRSKGDRNTKIEKLLQAVYIVQKDKKAVSEGRQPAVYSMGAAGIHTPTQVDLADHLNHLNFGSLRRASRLEATRFAIEAQGGGATSYLDEIERRARVFAKVDDDLKTAQNTASSQYPLVPDEMFIRVISKWWAGSGHRDVVTRTTLSVFGSVTKFGGSVVRALGYGKLGDNAETVQAEEAKLIRKLISTTMDHLSKHTPDGLLTKEESENLFGPEAVETMQEAALVSLQARRDLEGALHDHMVPGLIKWSIDNKDAMAGMRWDDFVQNVAPPAVSVALGTIALALTHVMPGAPLLFKGLGVQGGAIAQLAEWAAVAGGSKPHVEGVVENQTAARFRERFNELYVSFVEARMMEVATWLQNGPLDSILRKIASGKNLTADNDYLLARRCVAEILEDLPKQ